jgi:carbamoylphosphate synthase small subunit
MTQVTSCHLLLEDGESFAGESVGAPVGAVGEAVFTTVMTGYQEVVTDPSYSGQIVCFTAPMVGNYGVRDTRNESARPHAAAVVMREARGPEWTRAPSSCTCVTAAPCAPESRSRRARSPRHRR